MGDGIGVGGLHSLASGLGDGVLNIGASNLGDGVAVLNLNGDNLHLRIVNAVLGGDLTASVLHGGNSRVGNSGCNRGNVGNGSGGVDGSSGNGGSGVGSIELGIGLGISLSVSLHKTGVGNVTSMGSITQHINDLLADLLVLDLLGLNSLGAAHSLGGGGTGLGHKDLALNLAVRGGNSDSGGSVGNGNRGGNSGGGSVHGSYSGGSGQTEVGVAGGGQKGGVSLRVGRRGS